MGLHYLTRQTKFHTKRQVFIHKVEIGNWITEHEKFAHEEYRL